METSNRIREGTEGNCKLYNKSICTDQTVMKNLNAQIGEIVIPLQKSP